MSQSLAPVRRRGWLGRARRSPALAVTLGFVASLGLLAGVGGFAWQRAAAQRAAAAWVEHTYAVLAAVDGTVAALADAETSQRGYLLTGDSAYLAPYRRAVAEHDRAARVLRALTRDNATQQRRLDTLEAVTARRITALAAVVALRGTDGAEGALAVVRGGSGRAAMDSARAVAERVASTERALLTARSAREGRAAAQLQLALMLGFVGAGSIGVAATLAVRRDAARRARAEAARDAQAEKVAMQGDELAEQAETLAGRNAELAGQHAVLTQQAAALAASDARRLAVFTAMREAVVLYDEDGVATSWNPAAPRLFGLDERGFAARTAADSRWEAVREDGTPWAANDYPVARTLRIGVPAVNAVMGVRRPDGAVVWLLVNTRAVPAAVAAHATRPVPADASHGCVATFADVTQRKQEEESRRTAEADRDRARAQLVDAIQALEAGFAMWDADERLVVANAAYGELSGAPGALLTAGRPYADIVRAAHGRQPAPRAETPDPAGDPPSDPARDAATEATGEAAFVDAQLGWHRAAGPPTEEGVGGRWVRRSDQRMRDGGRVSLRTDVTALHRVHDELRAANLVADAARERAEAASQAKSDFLSRMNHELRTPLTGIIGFTRLLLHLAGGKLAPAERGYLERVDASSQHLLKLVNAVLDLARIEAGKLEVELAPVALDRLAADVVGAFELQAAAKGIALSVELPDRPSWRAGGDGDTSLVVVADALRLHQVLINLVGNALKFTERGAVTVRITADAATARPTAIDVEDSGVGVAPHRQAAVFDLFEQADGSTQRRYGGSGLGLAIARQLCELMGMRLELARSAPGAGSLFRIHLPPPAGAGAGGAAAATPAGAVG